LFEKEMTNTEKLLKNVFLDSSTVKNKLDKAGVKSI